MNRNWLAGIGVAVLTGLLTYFLMRPEPPAPRAAGVAQAPKPSPGGPGAPVARARAESAPIALVAEPDALGSLRLQGMVLDANDQPAAGAVVRVDSAPPRSVTTEKDGSFTFSGLLPRVYRLEARLGAQVALPAQVRVEESTPLITLRLRSASAVEVRVVDARDRSRISGASVELRGEAEVLQAITGAEGKARLEGVLPGRYVVKAEAPAHGPVLRAVYVGDAPLSAQPILMELSGGSGVAGEVVDGSGRPVEGVPVVAENAAEVIQLADASRDAVRTDARGQWRFPLLPPGTYRFVAGGAARAPGVSPLVQVDGRTERTGVVITLPQGARLSGQVVDRQEAPVPYALVRAVMSEGALGLALARQIQCDAEGRFTLEGLPQRPVDVVALHESATSLTRRVDLTGVSERTGVVLALDADLELEGTVVSATTGQPVAEAVVLAEPAASADRSRTETTLRGRLSSVADAAGRFTIRGLRPGTYLLRAAPPGTPLERRLSWLRNLRRVEAGTRGMTLELMEDGRIRGRVLKQDGQPPALFTVSVGGSTGGAVGSSSGEFVVPHVPAGNHVLMVAGPDFATRVLSSVTVRSGEETDVGTLNVDPGRKLEGRVLLPDGRPVAGALVTITKRLEGTGVVAGPAAAAMTDPRQVLTLEDGRFVLEGLGITPLNLAAEHPEHGRSENVPIAPGVEQARQDLVLQPGGSITGRVTQNGQPVAGALVLASAKDAPGGGTGVSTGTDGSYVFSSLSPGAYTVVAILEGSSGQRLKNATVQVSARGMARQDFEMPLGGLTLVVNAEPTADGRAQSARLFLEAAGTAGGAAAPGAVQTQPIADGTPARFTQLVPGSYRVCAVPSGAFAVDAGPPTVRPLCRFIAVAESPTEQQISLPLP